MRDGEVQLVAASLSYSTVLSIVPFLAVVLAALNSIGGMETLYPKVERMLLINFQDTLGSEGIRLLQSMIKRVLSGKFGTIGAGVLVLTSTRLIYDMERGLHRVWNIKNTRPLLQRLLVYWIFLLALPIVLALSVHLNQATPVLEIKNLFPSSGRSAAVFFVLIFLLNKMVPNIKVRWFACLVGSLMTTTLLLALQWGFGKLTHSVFQYSKLYGGIAAVPAFLIWVLLIWQIVLFGVAITASLHRSRN